MSQKLTQKQVQALLGNGDRRGPAVTKYPWTEWTDGNWWKITKGEDFDRQVDGMRTGLLNHASRHSMKVQVHRRGDSLVFQFTDNG